MKTVLRYGALLVPVLGCVAACGGGGECESIAYPAAPEGASKVVHVAACDAADADGSIERPYARIGQAVAAASSGTAVLVASGTYTENLTIDKSISIVGSTGGGRGEDASIILQAPLPRAISVGGGADVLLRGMRVVGARGAGVIARGASVTLEGSWIAGTEPNEEGIAYGVVGGESGAIILQNSTVTGSAGIGVVLSGSRGTIHESTISDNEKGGIRCDRTTEVTEIKASTLTNNASYGIGVFGAKAIILQNGIQGTRLGDGLLIAGVDDGPQGPMPSSVQASDNTISGSARVGVLLSGDARQIILQNNVIERSAGASFGAGLWLQAGAGADPMSRIEGNTISDSRFYGIGLTGDTHGIILQNNTVQRTILGETFAGAGPLEVGDGISVMKEASAQITGNKVLSSGRMGILIDSADAASTSIVNNKIENSDLFGIILQNQPVEPSRSGNTYAGNGSGTENVIPQDGEAFGIVSDVFATE